MRNTLYKAYLDDFAAFCNKLGGTTAEVMSDLLAFEADRRALNITLNSIGTGESFDVESRDQVIVRLLLRDSLGAFLCMWLGCVHVVRRSGVRLMAKPHATTQELCMLPTLLTACCGTVALQS
jgi:hypothetical protein